MLKVTIVLAVHLFSSFLMAQGFSGGNQMTATQYSGTAQVSCQEQSGRREYFTQSCGDSFLSPYEYDFFTSGEKIDADTVQLKSTDEDGAVVTKSQKYDVKKDRSAKTFNLWIMSLTQKPLLNYGKNKVEYVFLKSKKVVKSGEIIAEVIDGGSKRCRIQHLNYYNQFNCQNIRMQACNDYFARTYESDCR